MANNSHFVALPKQYFKKIPSHRYLKQLTNDHERKEILNAGIMVTATAFEPTKS